jgi:hypothetical protein
MTEKKPTGVSFESFVERQIREAQERGEFENLPGTGKPLPDLEKPYDELWWVKNLIEREQLSAALPPALALKRDVERGLEQAFTLSNEASVRQAIQLLNLKICLANRGAHAGPATSLSPLEADEVVREWRKRRRS